MNRPAIGGRLDPAAHYRFELGRALGAEDRFVVARLAWIGGAQRLLAVGFARAGGGGVVFERCAPEAAELCLEGMNGQATFAFIRLDPDAALVTGTVSESGAARAGVLVEAGPFGVVSE